MTATTHDDVFGCELVTGKLNSRGYANHVAVWEATNGPVPDGLVLDHRCRRRACVRVLHLEPVTPSENEKRKSWRYRAKKTRCPFGHDLKSNRMITPEGGVLCRQCEKESR